ncbi:MAG: nitric oxide-sensing transcriptional repressor NsrR [Rhodothalassiaceae bacterium]
MHLTRHTDYALRLLLLLAARKDGTPVPIPEAARLYGISQNHLMKVVKTLAEHGFVRTVRGRAGGLLLAMPATKISLGAVVRATEGHFAMFECMAPGGQCRIARFCRLPAVMHEALDAFLAVLDGSSIEDMMKDNPMLKGLLGAPNG